MAWPNFRELLAWALFVLVTAVHLHSRTQLELCMAQLDSPRTQMRANIAFPLVENGGASLPDEPNGAVVYTDPLFRAHTGAHQLACNFSTRSRAPLIPTDSAPRCRRVPFPSYQ
jgi:hypothetical protein